MTLAASQWSDTLFGAIRGLFNDTVLIANTVAHNRQLEGRTAIGKTGGQRPPLPNRSVHAGHGFEINAKLLEGGSRGVVEIKAESALRRLRPMRNSSR